MDIKKVDEDPDSCPIINDEEAKTVKLIYNLYWDQEIELKQLVDWMNVNKIKTTQYNKSGKWINPTVVRILKNHKLKYEGLLINNNIVGNCWGKILDKEYPEYPRKKKDISVDIL